MTAHRETTIILGPYGAGKSTRARALTAQYPSLIHVDQDLAFGRLLAKANISPSRFATSQCTADEISRLPSEFDRASALRRDLARATLDLESGVLVDFVPGQPTSWLNQTISMSRALSRPVVLEGYSIDPANALPRALRRNSALLLPGAGTMGLERPDSAEFKSFLNTYREMPAEFLDTAKRVDRARLFDTNAADRPPKLIAEWEHGERKRVLDEAAYNQFLKLGQIDVIGAHFRAERVGSAVNEKGRPVGVYEVRDAEFYAGPQRRHPATAARQPSASPRFD